MNYWLRPRIAVDLRLHTVEAKRYGNEGANRVWDETTFATGVLAGARIELNRSLKRTAPRPYLHVSAGPYFRPQAKFPVDPLESPDPGGTKVKFGTSLGAGVDLLFGSHLGLGIRTSYDWMPEFEDHAGKRFNYNGWDTRFSTSWYFGGGKKKKP